MRRIALSVVCACAALAVAAPATASAQSGVDEYTLDIPGSGGSGSPDQGSPPSAGGAAPSSAAASGTPSDTGSGGERTRSAGEETGSGDGGSSAAKPNAEQRSLDELDELHSGASSANAPLPPTDSRSAPEVVADTLFDGAMLPLLGALVAITGVGAWRLVRHRRTLTGTAG